MEHVIQWIRTRDYHFTQWLNSLKVFHQGLGWALLCLPPLIAYWACGQAWHVMDLPQVPILQARSLSMETGGPDQEVPGKGQPMLPLIAHGRQTQEAR
jgi:hypothetical protein